MSKHVFVVLLCLICLVACSPKASKNSREEKGQRTEVRPQLLFVTLEAFKEGEQVRFELVEVKAVDGQLKRSMPATLGDLTAYQFHFLDKDDNPITQVAIKHPLVKNVEVANENGTFEWQQIRLEKAFVVLRIAYFRQFASISIRDHAGNELDQIPLKL